MCKISFKKSAFQHPLTIIYGKPINRNKVDLSTSSNRQIDKTSTYLTLINGLNSNSSDIVEGIVVRPFDL